MVSRIVAMAAASKQAALSRCRTCRPEQKRLSAPARTLLRSPACTSMVLSSSTRTRISSWTMARTCTSLRMPRRPPTTCSLLSAASSALRAAGVRSTTSRWERRSGGVFDDASAAHYAEPGGGDRAAGYHQEEGPGGVVGMRRGSSVSSVSNSSSVEQMSRRTAGLHRAAAGRRRTVDAAARAAEDKRRHDLALKSASDLQREIFPQGVPSQGVLKSGLQAIEADVRFRAIGCERPWHGFIIDDVLYMYATEFYGNEHSFRNAVMALMELAEDVLQCESVIVALPKVLSPPPIVTQQGAVIPQQHLDTAAAASLVRAFLYSGFEMVSPMLYQPSPAYVLVGYDAM